MRVAALAFGVLAGLVASFILALGGLEVVSSAGAAPDRQAQILRFGLFVIANLGFFGAALVLAAPLAATIVLGLGAAAWVGAALYLHHTSDVVLIAPPALLLVAAALSIIAHLRRPRDASGEGLDAVLPPLGAATAPRRRAAEPEAQDFDDLPPTKVGAGFFGDITPTQPARVDPGIPQRAQTATFDDLEGLDQPRSPLDDKWNPRKRPAPPPRQRPVFRDIDEDDEDEPSGLARFGRAVAGILNFALYAGIAAAAVLVFWTLRNGDVLHPAVAKVEASSSAPATSSAPSAASSAASSEQILAAIQPSSSAERVLSLPPLSLASSEPAAPEASRSVAGAQGGVIVADDAFASSVAGGTELIAPSAQPAAAEPASEAASSASASLEPAPAETGDLTVPGIAAEPFSPPLEITAVRSGIKPPPRRAQPAPPANPVNNTGL